MKFENDNAIKLSASLSYFTIFITPLLIIIISILVFIWKKRLLQTDFWSRINGMVGNEAALQIQETKNIELSDNNFLQQFFLRNNVI
jgi:membrane protein